VEVNWFILKVSGVHSLKGFGVLHWDDVAFSKMEVEVICLGWECNALTLIVGYAWISFDNDVAPSSGWEVETGLVDINLVGEDSKFKGFSEHDVVFLILV
jgi:hypothetical protein